MSIALRRDSNLYVKAVVRLIRIGAKSNLTKVVIKAHPSDLATILEQIGINERREFLPFIFNAGKLGETLLEMVENLKNEIIEELDDKMLAQLLVELSSDDAVDLLESLEEERITKILHNIPDLSLRNQLRQLLNFAPETAGSIMQTEFLSLPETETIANAITLIKRQYHGKPIFYLYTIDSEKRLSGIVPLRKLLLGKEDWALKQVAITNVIKVTVDEDQEQVAALVDRYDLLAIPVVDSKNHLVGMITVDDVMDVIQEEASEDLYKLAGSDSEEMIYGDKILKISQIRLPWLIVSVATGMVTAVIIGMFSRTLEQVIALTSFIPVIAGMAGNVGTQSAAITVRGLALGRIDLSSIAKTVFREMRVGIILGFLSGIIVTVIELIWLKNYFMGIVIFISMFSGMTFAATTGTLMPMMFSKFGIDPAVSSGPLVTTLNDCVAVVIYLGVATLMLNYIS